MENKIFILMGIFLTFILIANIGPVSADTSSCNPTIKIINQDPYPAIPNEYVKVIFEITNLGSCGGFGVKLNTDYPFSLDPNVESIQTIEAEPYVSGYKNAWMIPYTIRIDPDALDGEYYLKLQYHQGTGKDFSANSVEKGFNITIQDSRTSFDAVIQESSGSDVSIAIANIGKYAANSVVVRIPEQNSFEVSGTNGQMVGNLASGDYTIVGYTLTQKRGTISQNRTGTTQTTNQLKIEIDYTDNIGERRAVFMDLHYNIQSLTSNSSSTMGNIPTSFGGNFRTTKTSTNYTYYIIGGVLLIVIIIYIFYRKNNKTFKKFSGKFKKQKDDNEDQNNKTPDWVKNAKEKEKKK
jgi:hypothetical protein